jgi:hypothetical protein
MIYLGSHARRLDEALDSARKECEDKSIGFSEAFIEGFWVLQENKTRATAKFHGNLFRSRIVIAKYSGSEL